MQRTGAGESAGPHAEGAAGKRGIANVARIAGSVALVAQKASVARADGGGVGMEVRDARPTVNRWM